jgi:metallo-beta-lactamase family protein
VETIKIHGDHIPVHAEVRQLDILSAHADQGDLLQWLRHCKNLPAQVFVNHGEAVPADTIRQLTTEQLGFPALVPHIGESFELT